MPRVRPATITLRDGTILRDNKDKIEYGPQLLSTFAVEMQSQPEERKGKWWQGYKKTTVQMQQQVKVPIKSWPYTAIKEIDWGYIPKAQYDKIMDELAKAKQAAEAKKQEKSDESGMGNSKDTTIGAE